MYTVFSYQISDSRSPPPTQLQSSSLVKILLASLFVAMPTTLSRQSPGRPATIPVHSRTANCNVLPDNGAARPRPFICESVTRTAEVTFGCRRLIWTPSETPSVRLDLTTKSPPVEQVCADRASTTVSSPTTPAATGGFAVSSIWAPFLKVQSF